jgi:hypothetical protein
MSFYNWVNREITIKYFCLLTMCILVPVESLLGIEWESLKGPTGGDVTCVFLDSDTTLWVGTGSSGGVYNLGNGDSTWVQRNHGIGISHVYKLIEIDNVMYSEVRRNSDLEKRDKLQFYKSSNGSYRELNEEKVEKLLTKWYEYSKESDEWYEIDMDDFEFQIITSEYDRWLLENKSRVNEIITIETDRNNKISTINENSFPGISTHFPPDITVDNIVVQQQKIFVYSKSGIYEYRNHSTIMDSRYVNILTEQKKELKEVIENEWVTPFKNKYNDSKITKVEYDSLITMIWDYYDNFKVFYPLDGNGLICTDPKTILESESGLIVQMDNFVWKYSDSTWTKIFDGYLKYFETGHFFNVSHIEQISQDSVIIFSEGSIYLYSNDTLINFLDLESFKNTKTGENVSPYYLSCNMDRGGVLWSMCGVRPIRFI